LRRRKALERLLIILILIIVASATGLLLTRLKTDQITDLVTDGKLINTMILIKDDNHLVYSELFMYDSKTSKGALFDIPGNIGSIIDKYKKMDRIDVLFDKSDPSPYVEKVSSILGTDIPYYVLIDINNFMNIVDLINGIKIFIANPIELLDLDNLVLLPSGNLVLDGYKAALYTEYDDSISGTVEHISRRQKILQSLFTKFGSNSSLLDIKDFSYYLRENLSTNLKKDAVISFFKLFSKLDNERIVFQRVLGNTRLVGEKNLLFPHYEGKLLRETIQQTIASLATTGIVSADELNITMDILNATGQSGLAGRTSQVFKSFGYDIVRVANYSGENLDKTIVVSLNSDISAAEKVADIIKCKEISYEPEIYFDENTNNNSEIIIIIGKDFDGRYCKE